MARRWYVVQTKQNFEATVVYHLKNQKFRCYLPQILINKKVRGVETEYAQPLFPSYLFVQFDASKAKWKSINGTKGVLKLLAATEDSVCAIPKGFIEEMLSRSDKRGFITIQKATEVMREYTVGDQLMIKDGVFQGFTGTYLGSRRTYAMLLLNLLSGRVNIKLPLSTLEIA